MSYYPIMLQLEGKKVIVVGGGKVAERKVNGLIGSGACIEVISPETTPGLKRLADDGKILWHQRSFLKTDCEGAFLIFAATDHPQINQDVKGSVGPNQLVMLADDHEHSDFHVPSRMQRGRLTIAVSTEGASPILASQIRNQLKEQFDENYEEYLEFLFVKRQWILKEVKDAAMKRKLLQEITSPEFLISDDREEDFKKLLT
ncbi:precorrin-2 dehydrogenase/sirohydrochlorin ferrochelatase family protein [Neobacillus sp. LXY-1]|uniref:precorrin-2 dehydrogenase/sirohydrochlorin ferrochelatase family protein n=1 Tax=Neobacillus sp. LXY-1 TaxID=3379133 RepID=UPI003EE2B27C